jgi:hypothetical protein
LAAVATAFELATGRSKGATAKDRVTGAAALQLASPAWLAVIEQVPTAIRVTVLPETVQTAGVAEAKVTAALERPVALTLTDEADSEAPPGALKVIRFAPRTTARLKVLDEVCGVGVAWSVAVTVKVVSGSTVVGVPVI